jgi:hypothetical protein
MSKEELTKLLETYRIKQPNSNKKSVQFNLPKVTKGTQKVSESGVASPKSSNA